MFFNFGDWRTEVERLKAKIATQDATIESITAEFRKKFVLNETDMELLRGQFNRKLSGTKKKDETESGVLQTNSLNGL